MDPITILLIASGLGLLAFSGMKATSARQQSGEQSVTDSPADIASGSEITDLIGSDDLEGDLWTMALEEIVNLWVEADEELAIQNAAKDALRLYMMNLSTFIDTGNIDQLIQNGFTNLEVRNSMYAVFPPVQPVNPKTDIRVMEWIVARATHLAIVSIVPPQSVGLPTSGPNTMILGG